MGELEESWRREMLEIHAAAKEALQSSAQSTGSGPTEPEYPGPFAVGRYAAKLREYLRGRARVRLLGEVTGLSVRENSVYFELRDADGAVPCAMWRNVYDGLEIPEGLLRDGAEVVVAGGLDYYPGSATASPSFNFRTTHLRLAGEGDLIAQLARLRKQLAREGVFDPQKRLAIPALPRAIGVVTGRDSAAKADVLAGLARRSWRGTIVFAYPPVQDRHAAPQISAALLDLAGCPELEAIIVARGGGSLADLWAFCDETLCRTIALLRVPVIAAVGHETDRTLIDDVAAITCSTPTHAAEVAVKVDVGAARAELRSHANALHRSGAGAADLRTDVIAGFARALAHHMQVERSRLHQLLREIRAAARRSLATHRSTGYRQGLVVSRKRESALLGSQRGRQGLLRKAGALERHTRDTGARRAETLQRLARTLSAHEPDRVLERGYAMVEGEGGEVLTRATTARRARRFRVRFSDDHVRARVDEDV